MWYTLYDTSVIPSSLHTISNPPVIDGGIYKMTPINMSHKDEFMNKQQIEHMFTYHAPTLEQTLTYNLLNQEFLALALKIEEQVKDSAERTIALRRLHEARMLANSAVALSGV